MVWTPEVHQEIVEEAVCLRSVSALEVQCEWALGCRVGEEIGGLFLGGHHDVKIQRGSGVRMRRNSCTGIGFMIPRRQTLGGLEGVSWLSVY